MFLKHWIKKGILTSPQKSKLYKSIIQIIALNITK